MDQQTKARSWYFSVTRKGRLRTKLLLSLLLVSVSLTSSTLLVVRHRVQLQVREQLREALRNSVVTFQQFQRQREVILEDSATLLANLPILEALMTSNDPATIQDGSKGLWKRVRVGGDLFVLADRQGRLMALHTASSEFTAAGAKALLERSLNSGESRDWWFGGGHLFQVFIRPIYFGGAENGTELGVLVLGSEINSQVVQEVRQVASSEVAFRYGPRVVASTLPSARQEELRSHILPKISAQNAPAVEIALGRERFLAASMDLPPSSTLNVSLVVLQSYDQATAFLNSLNRWLVGLGLAAVLAGSVLAFLLSDTFTRPLANLVGGVHALEAGNFSFPLEVEGGDEVWELTRSFVRMRTTLQSTQQELLQAERLATIGRMASTVSHDLRHSLTAILAYAEFLSEGRLTEARRVEFYQEIRQAVDQMTEQLQALLEFSRPKTVYHPVQADVGVALERAVRAVKARPEFTAVQVVTSFNGDGEGWFDPSSLERVFHNLLLNACEAVPSDSGRIEVSSQRTADGLEVRIADNGNGIPEEIRETLFQPFVTSGKDNGIGLGLAIVYKIVQDHGGQVSVEHTGAGGTVLRISLPTTAPHSAVATPEPTS